MSEEIDKELKDYVSLLRELDEHVSVGGHSQFKTLIGSIAIVGKYIREGIVEQLKAMQPKVQPRLLKMNITDPEQIAKALETINKQLAGKDTVIPPEWKEKLEESKKKLESLFKDKKDDKDPSV